MRKLKWFILLVLLMVVSSGCADMAKSAPEQLYNFPGGHRVQAVGDKIYYLVKLNLKSIDKDTGELKDSIPLEAEIKSDASGNDIYPGYFIILKVH